MSTIGIVWIGYLVYHDPRNKSQFRGKWESFTSVIPVQVLALDALLAGVYFGEIDSGRFGTLKAASLNNASMVINNF